MSSQNLEKVVQRAISDAAFRRLLQSNPEAALRGFKLTGEEVSALRSGDAGKLTSLGIDQRMSKVFTIGDVSLANRETPRVDIGVAGTGSLDSDASLQGRFVAPDGLATGSIEPENPAAGFGDPLSPTGYGAYPPHGGLAGPSQAVASDTTYSGDDVAGPGYLASDTGAQSRLGQLNAEVAPDAGVIRDEFDRVAAAHTGETGAQSLATSQTSAVEDPFSPEFAAAGMQAAPETGGQSRLGQLNAEVAPDSPGAMRDEFDRVAAAHTGETGAQSLATSQTSAVEDPFSPEFAAAGMQAAPETGAQSRLGQLNAEVAPDSPGAMRDEFDRVAAAHTGETGAQSAATSQTSAVEDPFSPEFAAAGMQAAAPETGAQSRLAQLNAEVAPDSTGVIRDEFDRVAAMQSSETGAQSRLGQLNAEVAPDSSESYVDLSPDSASVIREMDRIAATQASDTGAQSRLGQLNAEVSPDSTGSGNAFLTEHEAGTYAAATEASSDTTPDGNVIDPGYVTDTTDEVVRQTPEGDHRIADI